MRSARVCACGHPTYHVPLYGNAEEDKGGSGSRADNKAAHIVKHFEFGSSNEPMQTTQQLSYQSAEVQQRVPVDPLTRNRSRCAGIASCYHSLKKTLMRICANSAPAGSRRRKMSNSGEKM